MNETLKNKIENMTLSKVLELCFFHALTNPEQHNGNANSEEVMSQDTDSASDTSQVFKELKLVDALSALGVLTRLRDFLSVPDSYTNNDVFNRIYAIFDLFFDKKVPNPSSLEEITTWLNETGADFNLPSIDENIPDNVINLSDFMAKRAKD